MNMGDIIKEKIESIFGIDIYFEQKGGELQFKLDSEKKYVCKRL